MTTYTIRAGIAALVIVNEGANPEYTVIYAADGKPLEVMRNDDFSHSVPEELPTAVLAACAEWFARVFALPIGERDDFLKANGARIPAVNV